MDAAALGQDWRRGDSLRFAVAYGDYDGDGARDEARLVRSDDGRTVALALFLSSDREWHVVREWPAIESERLGVRRAGPGAYETACGKGTYDCAPGEPENVALHSDGVEWFYFEGMAQLVYVDMQTGTLRMVTVSD